MALFAQAKLDFSVAKHTRFHKCLKSSQFIVLTILILLLLLLLLLLFAVYVSVVIALETTLIGVYTLKSLDSSVDAVNNLWPLPCVQLFSVNWLACFFYILRSAFYQCSICPR